MSSKILGGSYYDPVSRLLSTYMALNQTSNNQVVDIAGNLKIPYQFNILERSGTDYGATDIHRRSMRTQYRVCREEKEEEFE